MGKVEEEKFIDIEKLLQQKNVTWLPKFVVAYLKRVIHQKDVNRFIAENKDVYNEDFGEAALKHIGIEAEIIGLENIPKEGGVILTANHPLGGMDAMALISKIRGRRNNMRFIVNDILLNLTNLKELFVGVNKHGKSSKESFNKVNELFASENAVCIFPAGLVSRRKKGVVRDLPWKRTFVMKAIENNSPVIPIFVSGELSNFFYNLSNFRTAIGIKTNIEMLYLVDELFKQKGKKITIVVGKPIDPKTFDDSKDQFEWAEWVKEQVYLLSNQVKDAK